MFSTNDPVRNLDAMMHSVASFSEGMNGMPFGWHQDDASDGELNTKLLSQVEQMIQQNALLVQKHNQLKTGPFGLSKGRCTVMILSSVGALAWILDLGASIWEEVQGDDANKALQFSVIPLNLIAIGTTAVSAWAWARYAGHVNKAAKAKPIPDTQIEQARTIQNALVPVQRFLGHRNSSSNELLKHLQHFDREYEFLPEHIQKKYPKATTIALLINTLDPYHPLRQEYEAAASLASDGLGGQGAGLILGTPDSSPRASMSLSKKNVLIVHKSDKAESSSSSEEEYYSSDDDVYGTMKIIRKSEPASLDAKVLWRRAFNKVSAAVARQRLEQAWGIPLNELLHRGVAVDRNGDTQTVSDLKTSTESIL